MQLTDLNVGVLFILAVSSMGVYGIALAGWASNNKYALLGGLRSSAQMISYELPMSLAIAAPLLIAGTLSLRDIVGFAGRLLSWLHSALDRLSDPFPQIFSFIIFMIAAFAETNRIPFDLPEAENELVAGFHMEYSSMKFAAFFMAEYANMVTVCCIATLLFLGGWHPLWPARYGSEFRGARDLPRSPALICIYHGLNPARRMRQVHSAGLRHYLSSARGPVFACRMVPDSDAALLVLAKVGFHSFRFHLDSRHAAALPL